MSVSSVFNSNNMLKFNDSSAANSCFFKFLHKFLAVLKKLEHRTRFFRTEIPYYRLGPQIFLKVVPRNDAIFPKLHTNMLLQILRNT